jgi:hypothetical protein
MFRAAMLKFSEACAVALADAESEMMRTMMWLENEQSSYWQGQLRKRQEAVAKAKDAVRMKKLYKDASGSRQSAIDEEKHLVVCMRRLEEAEQKILSVKKYTLRLNKEIQMYRGGVQRFATTAQTDIPLAAARLGNMIIKLEEYVSLGAPVSDRMVTSEVAGEFGRTQKGEEAMREGEEATERRSDKGEAEAGEASSEGVDRRGDTATGRRGAGE